MGYAYMFYIILGVLLDVLGLGWFFYFDGLRKQPAREEKSARKLMMIGVAGAIVLFLIGLYLVICATK
ncbi:MAG: hypothetical protein HY291_09850 [Planctomycetes bacterium]|nr:hypothetical protein [Planctomycetota bacterium]